MPAKKITSEKRQNQPEPGSDRTGSGRFPSAQRLHFAPLGLGVSAVAEIRSAAGTDGGPGMKEIKVNSLLRFVEER